MAEANLDTQLAAIKTLQEADSHIDTTTTPWSLVVKAKGTETILLRKALKDITGANIAAITTVIASQTETA